MYSKYTVICKVNIQWSWLCEYVNILTKTYLLIANRKIKSNINIKKQMFKQSLDLCKEKYLRFISIQKLYRLFMIIVKFITKNLCVLNEKINYQITYITSLYCYYFVVLLLLLHNYACKTNI